MVRRYGEPVEVSVSVDAFATAECRTAGRATGDPQAFIWRGRRYAVRAVQERWSIRRAWWRASEEDLARSSLERRVWRVEASVLHGQETGIFDLGLDEAGGDDISWAARWTLISAQD